MSVTVTMVSHLWHLKTMDNVYNPPPTVGYKMMKGEFAKKDYENTFQNNY